MLRLSVARYSGVQPPLLARFGSAPCSSRYAAELVVAVLRRDEQRAPAVAGRLVDVGAGREQHLDRLEIVRARRVDQRRQPAAVVAAPAVRVANPTAAAASSGWSSPAAPRRRRRRRRAAAPPASAAAARRRVRRVRRRRQRVQRARDLETACRRRAPRPAPPPPSADRSPCRAPARGRAAPDSIAP